MSSISCPHCHSEVPAGALVCKGCQGEVVYGIPNGAMKLLIVLSVIGGLVIGWGLFKAFYRPHQEEIQALWYMVPAMAVIAIALGRLFGKFFRGHVTVYRRYHSGGPA